MAQSGDEIAKILSAKRPRRGRWILAVMVVVGLAGGGYWYWQGQQAKSAVVLYTTETVERGALTVTVTTTGTVEPTTQVEVSSELSGSLASVKVDFNDQVTVGQVLAELDSTKLSATVENAKAQLASARARVTQAEATARETAATLETQNELAARGVATRKDSVGIEANDERARAAVDIARADLSLAEANLSLVQADLEKAVIRSPINGIVLGRTAEPGQIVAASFEAPVLFTLAEDLTHMDLLVDIDETDIGKVAVGDKASFTVDAYEGKNFPAVITQVRYAPETAADVVTYKAVLSVENPEQLLRPGMTATAVITVDEVTDALIVPNAALRYAPPASSSNTRGASGLVGLILPAPGSRGGAAAVGNGKSIYVLRDGAPVEVKVELGATDGKRRVVTSEDLRDGDEAILDQSSGRQG